MAIRGISGNLYNQNSFELKKVAKNNDDKNKGTDRVELSQEAKELLKSQNGNKMEDISKKVDSGFYLQKNVTEKVATSILKELFQK